VVILPLGLSSDMPQLSARQRYSAFISGELYRPACRSILTAEVVRICRILDRLRHLSGLNHEGKVNLLSDRRARLVVALDHELLRTEGSEIR
jgi:hypothetical protein